MNPLVQNSSMVSIIVNNYNYANFIAEAIDSALGQSYKNIEVIVVDDGSSDESDKVIRQYLPRIKYIRKDNGGQASAMNCGFSVSKGEFVLFLDSDDSLYGDAIRSCMDEIAKETGVIVSKVQAPLEIESNQKDLNGKILPYQSLHSGSLREFSLEHGPASYPSPPTSGNLWNRKFLSQVFPIPESLYRKSADAYLFTLSPLFGQFIGLKSPMGKYRLHGRNNYWNNVISIEKLRYEICQYKQRCLVMEEFAIKQCEAVNSKLWRLNNRYYLAKIISLWKLKGSNQIPVSFKRFSHAVANSNIALHKKLAWLVWFICMAIAPHMLSLYLVRAYINLSFRV